MDLVNGITESKFTLVLMNETQYEHKLIDLVKGIEEKCSSRLCYICLSKPYKDVVEHLKNIGLNPDKFYFIDVLSSHYEKQKTVENCIFIQDPTKLLHIQAAIKKAVMEHNCDYLIFDTISSLFMYEQKHDIVKFAHELTIEKKQQEINKVFIVIKEKDALQEHSEALIKDVKMFADKTIDFGS